MRLSALGEFGLIHRIQKLSARKSPGIVAGIGDDAAVLAVSSNSFLLATTDMLIEGAHFDLSLTDFYSLGWKSAAVNLSDIAAMGGRPRFCLTSLGIPPRITVEQITEFYRGFSALLRTHNASLVGGDTCSSLNDLHISVTVLGEVEKRRAVTRSGAKPGDGIFVTNTLGDSAAGLEILKAGIRGMGRGPGSRVQGPGVRSKVQNSTLSPQHSALIRRHLRPNPRVSEGRAIALSGCASAMIDISDGLSSDLSHICEQSNVGALVHAGNIPFAPALLNSKDGLKKPLLYYALSGGEDYELLFTVPRRKMKKLSSLDVAATQIGEIVPGRALLIEENGRKKKLRPTGYNHFTHSAL